MQTCDMCDKQQMSSFQCVLPGHQEKHEEKDRKEPQVRAWVCVEGERRQRVLCDTCLLESSGKQEIKIREESLRTQASNKSLLVGEKEVCTH